VKKNKFVTVLVSHTLAFLKVNDTKKQKHLFINFMQNFSFAYQKIESCIQENYIFDTPDALFEPYRYIMSLGGKRMRPMLTLLGFYIFDDHWEKALIPAISTEVFHNFTLLHDDIMDNAPLRRGKQTVHEKWNSNIAILSGDMMLIEAYNLLNKYPFKNPQLAFSLFGKCAIDVCRGQQFDMNFAAEENIFMSDYLEMIRLKTAVLPAYCLQLGAICAGASEAEADILRQVGEKIGLAFQIKDDYLDAFGDSAAVGKQIGGDILENKKTLLYIKAYEIANEKEKLALDAAFNSANSEKVKNVLALFYALKVDIFALELADKYFQEAYTLFENVKLSTEKHEFFLTFFEKIRNRTH